MTVTPRAVEQVELVKDKLLSMPDTVLEPGGELVCYG